MENWIKIIQESFSVNDSSVKIFGYANSRSMSKIKKFIEENLLDVSHFGIGKKNIKHDRVIKICPVCEIEFKTICDLKGKLHVLKSASIMYFQHGINNPNFDIESYKDRYMKVSQTIIKLNQLKPKSIKIAENKKNDKKDRKPRIKLPMPKCGICLNPVLKRYHRFCSDECRKIHFNSEEYRMKMSEVHKELYKSGKTKGWSSRNIESYPEKFFKRVLENNNIQFEFNKPILKKDLGVDEVGSYFLDFYISNKNIDLEIDGGQHRYRKDHDNLRDSRISKSYNVYRIKWKNINTDSGKKYIKEEIDKFLSFYHNI